MTLKCTFRVTGVNHSGEREVLRTVDNIITYEGLKLLAGSTKLKTPEMPENFSPYVNSIFLGTGTRPTSIADQGLEALSVILPGANRNTTNGNLNRFTTMPVYLPAGTYTELAIGYHNPVGNVNNYYNRAILDEALVVDAAFYDRYKMIEFEYEFNIACNTGNSRVSKVDINGNVYAISIFTYPAAPWNEYYGIRMLHTDTGSAYAGPIYQDKLTVSLKQLSPAVDNVGILEIKAKNETASNQPLEWIGLRMGSFFHTAIVHNDANKEVPLIVAPGETVTLQMEFHYLSNYFTEFKLAQTDSYEGGSMNHYRLDNSNFSYNPNSFQRAYRVTLEGNVRTDYARMDLFRYDYGRFVPLNERINDPGYLTIYSNGSDEFVPGDNTEIYKFYTVDFEDREHLVKVLIGQNVSSYTFGAVNSTANATLTNPGTLETGRGIILNSKPSSADQVSVYDAYLDKLVKLPIFKTASNADAVIIPESILGHDVAGVVAIKYSSSTNATLKGIWGVLNRAGNTFSDLPVALNQIPQVTTLQREAVATTPIIGLKYNRTTKTISGTVLNANKIKFVGQEGNTEVHEFDVTPNSEFTIDLSGTVLSVAVAYKIVAWNATTGDSDGPISNGFVSVAVPAITDAVYTAATLKITFTRPAMFIRYAVLRRWGFDFYKIELVDGVNTLNLTSVLDETGQWELIAVDEFNAESEPFYIFGEKPDDIAVKPAQTTPVLNPVLNTSVQHDTHVMGFYIDAQNATRKWWENLQWFGSINDEVATVTYTGIQQRYPWVDGAGNTNYIPFLSFEIRTADGNGFEFKLFGDGGQFTAGYWSTIGSYYNATAKIKLWHDWIIYDGNNNSDIYIGSRKESNKIYGTGNGYHQLTEISQGHIRRALGIVVNMEYETVSGGSCPVNFDAEVTSRGSTLPILSQHLPYMRVVFGHVAYAYPNPTYMPIVWLSKYSVLINGKLATITDKDIYTVEGQADQTRWVIWTNEDGVSYKLTIADWTFMRTDRDLHKDDPAYQEIVDTIQLCYGERANPQWFNHWAFQSDAFFNRAFDSNIRQLTYGSYWQSIKGWLRPYYKPTALMTLDAADLDSYEQTASVIPFNFDSSKLDEGNEMQFILNGEPATLETIVLPQEYVAWDSSVPNGVDPLTVVGPYDINTSLYASKPVVSGNRLAYNYIPAYNNPNIPPRDLSWTDAERFLLDFNKTAYELYRNRLANPNDYLTYDQMLTALFTKYDSYAIDSRLIPVELQTKKILVPIYWSKALYQKIAWTVANDPTTPVIGDYDSNTYTYNYTVNITDYLSSINNPGLSDANKVFPISYNAYIIGHREFAIADMQTTSVEAFRDIQSSVDRRTDSSLFIIFSDDSTISDLGYSKIPDRYSFWNEGYIGINDYYVPIMGGTQEVVKAMSLALFGEDRGYAYSNDPKLFSASGLFNLAYARAQGLTGKYIMAIGSWVSILYGVRSFKQGNPGYALFDDMPIDDYESHISALVLDKPVMGKYFLLDYLEIDLSKTDAELAAIADISRTGFMSSSLVAARLGISVDGFDRYIATPPEGFGISYRDGKPLTPYPVKAVTVQTNSLQTARRRIVSANYTLEETTKYKSGYLDEGYWYISRGLEVNDIDLNNRDWKTFSLVAKTKYFNTLNVFASSRTNALTKTLGNDVGHYVSIKTRGYDMYIGGHEPRMLDPRKWPVTDYYNQGTSLSYLVYKMLSYTKTYIDPNVTGPSQLYSFACNNDMMLVVPSIDMTWKYSDWSPSDYVTNKVFAKLINERTGEHIANLLVTISGYNSSTYGFEMVTTTPGLYRLVMLAANLPSNLSNVINNFYVADKVDTYTWVYGAAEVVYDYNNPPALSNVDVNLNNLSVDVGYSPAQFANDTFNVNIPLPAWEFASTVELLLANYNIFIHGENTVNVTREEVVDVFNGVTINAVKYTIVSTVMTIAIYYSSTGLGGYRAEVVTIHDNNIRNIYVWFESIKTKISDQGNALYTPAFTQYYPADDILENRPGSYDTNTVYNVVSGQVYYTRTSDGSFYKPTVVFAIVNNENTGGVDAVLAAEWLESIKYEYVNLTSVMASEYAGGIDDTILDDVEFFPELIPVPYELDGFYVIDGVPVFNYQMTKLNSGNNIEYQMMMTGINNIAYSFDTRTQVQEFPEGIMPAVRMNVYQVMNAFLRFRTIMYIDLSESIFHQITYGAGGVPVDINSPYKGIYIVNENVTVDGNNFVQYFHNVDYGGWGARVIPDHNKVRINSVYHPRTEQAARVVAYGYVNKDYNAYAEQNMWNVPASAQFGVKATVGWFLKGNIYADEPQAFIQVYDHKGRLIPYARIESFVGESNRATSIDLKYAEGDENTLTLEYNILNSVPFERIQSQNSTAFNSVSIFDIFYATGWVEEGTFADIELYDISSGLAITYEDALGMNSPNLHLHRESRTDGNGAVYHRWFIWERWFNPEYGEKVNVETTDMATYLESLLLEGANGDDPRVGDYIPEEVRLGKDNFPVPNLNIFHVLYPDWVIYEQNPAAIPAAPLEELFNTSFTFSIDGVEGVWQNAVYTDDPRILTIDWVHPLVTVTYTYTNPSINPEGSGWDNINYDAITCNAVFASTDITKINLYVAMKSWIRPHKELYGSWVPYPVLLTGTDNFEDPAYSFTGTFGVIAYDNMAAIEIEAGVYYIMNETRATAVPKPSYIEFEKEIVIEFPPDPEPE